MIARPNKASLLPQANRHQTSFQQYSSQPSQIVLKKLKTNNSRNATTIEQSPPRSNKQSFRSKISTTTTTTHHQGMKSRPDHRNRPSLKKDGSMCLPKVLSKNRSHSCNVISEHPEGPSNMLEQNTADETTI